MPPGRAAPLEGAVLAVCVSGLLITSLSGLKHSVPTRNCVQQLIGLCGRTRSENGSSACLTCCGRNQHDLRLASCDHSDLRTFCGPSNGFEFAPPETVHVARSAVHASPIVLGDTVLFSTLEPDCSFYRLNISSGTLVWRFDAPRRDITRPSSSRCGLRASARVTSTAAGDHHIHIGSDNNSFIALQATSGHAVWWQPESSSSCIDSGKRRPCEVYSTALILPGPAASAVHLRIQGSEDGLLRAFDAATGDHLWNVTIGKEVNGSPVANPLNTSQIVIGADDGYLHCFVAATGEQCGRVDTCGQMDTMPSVDPVGGLLFYTCYYPPEAGKDYNHPRGWVGAVDLRTFGHRWFNNGTGGIPAFNPYHR